MTPSRKQKLNILLNLYIFIGSVLVIAGIGLILFIFLPGAIYSAFPQAYENEVSSLTIPVVDEIPTIAEAPHDDIPKLPPQDPALPKGERLRINKIDVDTSLTMSGDAVEALNDGPWADPQFGTPLANNLPIIIASHRWGGIGWSSEQRTKSSFNKLPSLGIGDTIELTWDQRKFEYKVYAVEENTQISDYKADLILYTCKFLWNSPVRIFVYAERVGE